MLLVLDPQKRVGAKEGLKHVHTCLVYVRMYTCARTGERQGGPQACTHVPRIRTHVHMCLVYVRMYTCACTGERQGGPQAPLLA